MEEDVEFHVKSYLVCQQDNIEMKAEAGLLQPLPIVERPWQSIFMDFIVGFPEVKGMKSILVVVDRFSKYAVFIPAPNACTANVAAELIFKLVTGIHDSLVGFGRLCSLCRFEVFHSKPPTNQWSDQKSKSVTQGVFEALCDGKSEEQG